MRIRKNLKLSSTSSSSSEDPTFHAHLCQLNQSPWDLIPFHSHSFYQFEYDDSSFTAATVTAANGDSIRAVDESVASMMDIDEQAKLEDVAAIAMMELVDDNAKGSAKLMVTANNESSGGGATNRSYNKKPSPPAAAAAARGGSSRANNNKARAASFKKPAAAATAPSTNNPYEFYYYSGFGPSWSTKRRGDRSGREASKNNGIENSPALRRLDDSGDVLVSNITTSPSTTTTIAPDTITDDIVVGSDNNSTIEENCDGLDYELDLMIDEEDEEEDCGDYGKKKKRMRKPVKARSLKSLM